MIKHTEEEIREKLITDDRWVERALVAIFKFQTEEEKSVKNTVEKNGVGFSAFDAPIMTYCANWLLKGHHLSGKFLERAHQIMPKYAKQLAVIANNRKQTT